jgi:ADP-dependent NAD(P)H-hydrate dehydratase / NAD(P)H-hydrate epimerase
VTCGIASSVLMENAGIALAGVVAVETPPGGLVLVACGPGNNGGDGYVAARFLRQAGVRVRVARIGAPATPDAEQAAADWDRGGPEAPDRSCADLPALDRALREAALVVDAVFGVGLSRPVREPYLAVLRLVESLAARRVAADVPSGMDADTGEPMPVAVRADVTVAMGFVKRGCTTAAGRALCGRIVAVDIGLPPSVSDRFLAR